MDPLSKPAACFTKPSQALILSLAFSALAAQTDAPAQPISTKPAQVSTTLAQVSTTANGPVSTEVKAVETAPSAKVESQSIDKDIKTPEGWKIFTPPLQDFRILLPEKVKKTANDKAGRFVMMYFQRDNGIDYLIADGVYINPARKAEEEESYYQDAVSTIEKQLTDKNPTLVKELSDVDGKGWHGRQVLFKKDDGVLATIRIAFSAGDDVAYKMLASGGTDNPNIKAFFDSFEVNPAQATKAHADSAPISITAETRKESKGPGVKNFVNVVWTISAALLAVCFLGFLLSGLRKPKDKDSDKNSQS